MGDKTSVIDTSYVVAKLSMVRGLTEILQDRLEGEEYVNFMSEEVVYKSVDSIIEELQAFKEYYRFELYDEEDQEVSDI